MKKKKVEIDLPGIGDRMKAIRKRLGLMQRDFIKIVNITMSTLSDIETGKKRPSSEILFILSDVYKVNLHYLLHGEGDMFRSGAEEGISGITLADDIFGEYTDDFKEILWYMKHSLLARAAIIVMAKEYCLKNEEMLKKEMKKKEEKNKDKKEKKYEK